MKFWRIIIANWTPEEMDRLEDEAQFMLVHAWGGGKDEEMPCHNDSLDLDARLHPEVYALS